MVVALFVLMGLVMEFVVLTHQQHVVVVMI
jgi:hypothetical protein